MKKKPDWRAINCWHCDFSMGTRGMDRCYKCDGTGSQIFHIPSKAFYPNTEDGWKELEKVHGKQVE